MWWEYLLCGGIGGLVGSGELVARYRDDPIKALGTVPALVYVGMNAVASVAAFGLIQAMDWKFGAPEGSPSLPWLQILIGGFGAMALFRSSLFMVRISGSDVGVGPIGFLQVVLGAADRGVDRKRAAARATRVHDIMEGVAFDKAAVALPTLCLSLMQNASALDQETLGVQVTRLRENQEMDPDVKVLALGLALMNFAGAHVLSAAVDSLMGEISEQPRRTLRGRRRRLTVETKSTQTADAAGVSSE